MTCTPEPLIKAPKKNQILSMNLILIEPNEWPSNNQSFDLTITDRRASHIIDILKSNAGDTLRAGQISGNSGPATVLDVTTDRQGIKRVVLSIDPVTFTIEPPPPSPVNLVIALPRPKTARRIVRTATELGVKKIHFINSYKVEKSYWQSPLLAPENLQLQVLMGLEQSSDTLLPEIQLHKLFRPFVEDRFVSLLNKQPAFLAQPHTQTPAQPELNSISGQKGNFWIVIGPEGGFTDYENTRLIEAGCKPVSFGKRVLRTETVIPFLMGLVSPTGQDNPPVHAQKSTPVPPSPQ